jgi:hypothetical protein
MTEGTCFAELSDLREPIAPCICLQVAPIRRAREADEALRFQEYSAAFDEERFAAHESFHRRRLPTNPHAAPNG